ncbi:uncharacterized protein LOC110860804 [Folsomia candida]|uniref:uncharacterized protein LOC110860804 n=1 Tax=Folsomia candida TaxID=158441 RepID=UPI000B8F709E|nr:uncharacterized protein LOC110860804 [Folsomia candida]
MTHLTLQVETLSVQLNILQEFIELKFGLDFKEFQNFKQTHPSGGIVLVKKNNIHQIQDDTEVVTKTEHFTDDTFAEDNFEDIINPENPYERIRFKNIARISEPATTSQIEEQLRARGINWDNDDDEELDDNRDDDDYHEDGGSSLPITNVANFTGNPQNYKRKTNPNRKLVPSRTRQEEILQRKRSSIIQSANQITTDYDDAATYIPEKKRAKIYGYFDWDETLRKYICKRCQKSYRCPRGGGTGSLHNHLRTHADLNRELKNNDTLPQIMTTISLTGGQR